MSDTKDQNNTSDAAADKGKGKAVEQPDISMDEESSDEESAAEDQVSSPVSKTWRITANQKIFIGSRRLAIPA